MSELRDGPGGHGLLAGRTAIVTGGTSGLGAAIASAFDAEGATGAVLDLHLGAGSGPPAGWVGLEADVTDEVSLASGFAQVAERYGPPQVVVANAGIVPPWTATEAIDLEEWERVFAVNARGVMLTVREAVRAMPGPGSIVAMASLNGWKGDPHIPAYVASKHAVVGLVRAVALDVGRRGVRVNAIGPGPVATAALRRRMAGRAGRTGLDADEALARAAEVTALGRIATAGEVAAAAVFLASDLSSAITGHLLPVDGGIL